MATATNHMKDRGGLDECGNVGRGEKCLGSRCILSGVPIGLGERLDMG